MNIDKIKNEIKNLVDEYVQVKINIGRNRFETVSGVIKEVYPFLFIIKVNSEVKSFSYADVLTKNVVIEKL